MVRASSISTLTFLKGKLVSDLILYINCMFPPVDSNLSEQPTFNSATNQLKKDFSFSRTELSGESTIRIRDILSDLNKIPHDKVCQLFMDEIFQSQKLRGKLLLAQNKIEAQRQEILHLKENIRKKTQQFISFNERQRSNTQKIGALEEQMRKFKQKHKITSQEPKQSEWQQKYNELWKNVDMYIANIRQLQQSFKRHKEIHNKQTSKMHSINESMLIKLRQQEIKIAILQQLTRENVPRENLGKEKQLKQQLEAADRLLQQFKNQLKLLNSQLEITRSQLKKEQDRNGEIRQELDRFCLRKVDYKASDEVLSQIDLNHVSRKRRWQSQNKQSSVWDKQNNSCIIGQEFTTS